jgi:hypothetical protein
MSLKDKIIITLSVAIFSMSIAYCQLSSTSKIDDGCCPSKSIVK